MHRFVSNFFQYAENMIPIHLHKRNKCFLFPNLDCVILQTNLIHVNKQSSFSKR